MLQPDETSVGITPRNPALGVPHSWQFGSFEFDPEAGVLRKFGLKRKISPQVACVLQMLLQRSGELVTREQLAEALWPGGIHVDFEGNLNTIVRDARRALNDSARRPRFIQTEFKRGYRFVAPARVLPRPVAGAGEAGTKPEQASKRRFDMSVWWRVLGVALIVAIAVGVVAIYRWKASANTALVSPRVVQLTGYLGSAAHPSFSPDGSRVAFEWNGEENGRYAIWIKQLASGKLLRLTSSSSDEHSPAWSPDGRDIAFLRDVSQRDAALVVSPALGGTPRQIAALPRGSSFAWSPDGRWIAYSISMPDYVRHAGNEAGIQAISLETGQSVRVTTPGSVLLGDAFPAFSPDGRWLAFFRLTSLAEDALYAIPVGHDMRPLAAERQITPTQRDGRDPVWLAGNREIVFSAASESAHGLWLANLDAGPVSSVWGGEDAIQPTVDAVHGRIAYTRLALVDSLNTLALCGDGCTPGAAKRLLFAERRASNPTYSRDGKNIAFESYRTGHMEIWSCTRDGNAPTQLSQFNGPLTGTPRWSPAGDRIVFDSRAGGHGKIFIVRLTDRHVEQFSTGSSDNIVPSWSHDGKSIYFASNRSGSFQVWRAPATGGDAVQVTKNGGFYAQESVDGRTLYYARDTVLTSIWKVPTTGGREEEVIPSVSAWQNFFPAREGIYFVPSSPAPASIQLYDVANGTVRLVAPINAIAVQGFSVSPDGRTIVFSKRESATSDLMLLESATLRGKIGSQ